MGSTVKVKSTGDSSKLLQEYDKVIRKQGRVINELRKTAREAKRGGDDAKRSTQGWGGALGGLTGQITGVVGGLASIGTAIKLINDEIQKIENRRSLAAQTVTGVGAQFAPAISALNTEITPEQLRRAVDQAATGAFISRTEALGGAAAALSSLASGSPELFAGAILQGARFSELTAGADTGLFAGAAAKFADLIGTQDPRVALGTIFKLGAGTPITEPSVQAQNLPIAFSKVLGFEKNQEAAAELLSAVLQTAKDPTGLLGGTAAAGIAERVRTTALPFGPEGAKVPLPAELRGDKTLDILRFIRSEAERRGFDEAQLTELALSLSEGATAKAFVTNFLTRDPQIAKTVAFSEGLFGPLDTPEARASAAQAFEQTLATIRRQPEVQDLLTSRAFESAAEDALLADPFLRQAGIIQEGFKKLLPALPTSALRDRLTRAGNLITEDKRLVPRAIEEIQSIQEDVLNFKARRELFPILDPDDPTRVISYGFTPKRASEEQQVINQRVVEALERIEERLKEQLAMQERANNRTPYAAGGVQRHGEK